METPGTPSAVVEDGAASFPSGNTMVVYELQIRHGRRVLATDDTRSALEVGDLVRVQLDDESMLAKVVWKGIVDAAPAERVGWARVERPADKGEVSRFSLQLRREADALEDFDRKIKEHGLPMEPLEVDFPGGDVPITFYFAAPHRVDFRELVRSLARTYRTRIELRQVSPRQRAQWATGCGSCGRPFCCATFMGLLPQVSSEAARAQSLSQTSSKLIGRCGQLKCCLRHELDFYNQADRKFPRTGQRVSNCGRTCIVEGCDIFRERVRVRDDSGYVTDLALVELEQAVDVAGGGLPEERGTESAPPDR